MSTREQQEAGRLSEQAETLLDGWPAPSRSALEWEDLANATVARIRETTVGSTGDELLVPPLPKEEGEGELSEEKPQSEPADEPGLLAIAKAAVSTGASEDEKDIVRAGLRAAEHSRQSHPPAPPTRAAGQHRRGTPSSAAGLQGHMPKSSARPVEAVHEAQARSELPARAPAGSDKVGAGVIVGGAMLALAAGVALYIGMHRNAAESMVATSHESAQSAPATPVAEAPAAAAAQGEEAAKPHALALEDLKPTEVELPEEHGKVAVPSATSPMSLALKSNVDRASPASAPAPEAKKSARASVANAAPAAPQQQAVTLKETEEAATSEELSAQTGAADKQTLPSRPSYGAITAAFGSVMTGAKSCLAGQEVPSKATVTFGSDGHVKSVSLAGPAAGTPAEGCVRSALMAARVPPFSEPEYSASFTVRPP